MLVLVVDDDQDDLEIFCDAVKEIDPTIHLITSANGQEALNYLLTRAVAHPDYVFLDINMPQVDGRECLKAIRENKLTGNLRVIMYSTSLSKADKALFESLNARFLVKASNYVKLVESLRDVFGTLKTELNAREQLLRDSTR
jgi:CheY-like chemotaxis protein